MPIIPLSDSAASQATRIDCDIVSAIMIFGNNVEGANRMIATARAQELADNAENRSISSEANLPALIRAAALADSPASVHAQQAEIINDAVVSGLIVHAAISAQKAGKAWSMRKYVDTITRRLGRSRAHIHEVWRQYKSVGHLWSAQFAIAEQRTAPRADLVLRSEMPLFLSLAMDDLRLASAIRAPRAHGGVLDPDIAWVVSPDLALPSITRDWIPRG